MKVRKQFFIDEPLNSRLKSLAASTGKSEGELIRGSIAMMLDVGQQPAKDWKDAWLRAAGMWADHSEIEEQVAQGRRSWGRRSRRLFGQCES